MKDKWVTLKVPKNIKSHEQLSKYMWKQYHIDIDLSRDRFGQMFYNDDLRSHVGFLDNFNPATSEVTFSLATKYYPRMFKKEWARMRKKARIRDLM